jgi:peptide/nickel transport system ATP-binding protein
MEGPKTILSVRDLCISFSGNPPFIAVDHLSFSVDAGQTLAVVGESGSGKSLTALALMGLLPKEATVDGTIELSSLERTFSVLNLQDQEWRQMRGKTAGMVFQEPMSALNPVMKIGHQLKEAIITHQNISEKDARLGAIKWLNKVQLPAPEKVYHRYPHQLSGGQKQRVMIAMAMCNEPALLIADEPTTALDVTVQMEIVALMKTLQEQTGTAMIFITHDLSLAATIADEVMVMYRGATMEHGNAKNVLQNPQHPYTKALIACKPSPEHKGKTLPIVADFLGEEVLSPPLEVSKIQTSGAPVLEVNNLKVWFPEDKNWLGKPLQYFKAVNDVSFTLCKGEVLGLVGESGCGKSTLSRSLMGLIPIHEGQILFKGRDLTKLNTGEWKQVRRSVQMIFQDPYGSLNPRITIGDMLMEPLKVHNIVSRKDLKKETLRLLDLVHLPKDSLKRYPHQFSGGQRQRLGIARALAMRPEILICDESVSALDVSIQAQILNLLKELQAEFQLSYLFISHDLSVVYYISDRVMVMQTGEIVERGKATDILTHPINDYTKRLIASIPQTP